MAQYVTKIRTETGDKQIDYNALANKPTAQSLGAAPVEHKHTKSEISDFPTSLPANGGNADTLDDKHASDFALASNVETIKTDVDTIKTSIKTIESDVDTLQSGVETIQSSVEAVQKDIYESTFNLSNVVVTTEELNYVKGVTSDIQAQLNGKAASDHTHSYLSLSGGTVRQLTVNGNFILVEGVNYGAESQRPSAGVKGRVYLQKVVT